MVNKKVRNDQQQQQHIDHDDLSMCFDVNDDSMVIQHTHA